MICCSAPRKRKPLDAKKVTPHINGIMHLEPRDGTADPARRKKNKHHRKRSDVVGGSGGAEDGLHGGEEWGYLKGGAVTMTDAERRREEERQRHLATTMRGHGNPLDMSMDASHSFSYDGGSGCLDSSMEDDLLWPSGSSIKEENKVGSSPYICHLVIVSVSWFSYIIILLQRRNKAPLPSRKNGAHSTPDGASKASKKKRRSNKSSASSSFEDSFSAESVDPLGDHMLFHRHSASALTPNFDQLGLADAENFHFRPRADSSAVDADDVAALTALCTPGLFSPGDVKFFESASPRPLGTGASLGLNTFGKLMGTPNGQRDNYFSTGMTPAAAAGLLGDTPMVPYGFHTATTPLSEISFNMSPSIFSPNGRGFQLTGTGNSAPNSPFVGAPSTCKRGVASGGGKRTENSAEYSPVIAATDLSISSSESPSALQVLATMSAKKSQQPRNQPAGSPSSRDITSLVSGADTPYDMRGEGVQLSMELGGDGAASSAGRSGIASAGRRRGGRHLAAEDGDISPIAPLQCTGLRLYGDDDEAEGDEVGAGSGQGRASRAGLRSASAYSATSHNTTRDDGFDSSMFSRFGMGAGSSMTPQSLLKKRSLLDVSADLSEGSGPAAGLYNPQEGVSKRLNTSSMSGISSVGEEDEVATPYKRLTCAADNRYFPTAPLFACCFVSLMLFGVSAMTEEDDSFDYSFSEQEDLAVVHYTRSAEKRRQASAASSRSVGRLRGGHKTRSNSSSSAVRDGPEEDSALAALLSLRSPLAH
jgi:hypothetical protein